MKSCRVLLQLLAVLPICTAVDRNNFKTCEQSAFCKRNRAMEVRLSKAAANMCLFNLQILHHPFGQIAMHVMPALQLQCNGILAVSRQCIHLRPFSSSLSGHAVVQWKVSQWSSGRIIE